MSDYLLALASERVSLFPQPSRLVLESHSFAMVFGFPMLLLAFERLALNLQLPAFGFNCLSLGGKLRLNLEEFALPRLHLGGPVVQFTARLVEAPQRRLFVEVEILQAASEVRLSHSQFGPPLLDFSPK